MYQETELFSGLLFIEEGCASFVFPRFKNAVYATKSKGQIIGFEDYMYDLLINEVNYKNIDDRRKDKNMKKCCRKFTVMVSEEIKALELPVKEVIKMRKEFP